MKKKKIILAALALGIMGIASWYGHSVYVTQFLPNKLITAVAQGDTNATQRLISSGIDPNLSLGLESNSPLFRAIESNNPEMVKLLLENGANPNKLTETGSSPLIHAAFFGNQEIVKLLIKHGSKVDIVESRNKTTALITAVRKENIEVVRQLISAKADVNQGSSWGDAPLCRAKQHGNTEIFNLLEKSGGICSH